MMIKFSKQDLLKVANLSALKLRDSEIPKMLKDIQNLLEYVEQLNEVKDEKQYPQYRNKNIFREDKKINCEVSNNLLKSAPKTKDNYFVVPSAFAKASADKPAKNDEGEQ